MDAVVTIADVDAVETLDKVEPGPPDELYEKLEPFKERVAEDIRES